MELGNNKIIIDVDKAIIMVEPLISEQLLKIKEGIVLPQKDYRQLQIQQKAVCIQENIFLILMDGIIGIFFNVEKYNISCDKNNNDIIQYNRLITYQIYNNGY